MILNLDIDNVCNADALPDKLEIEPWVSSALVTDSSTRNEVELSLRIVSIEEISALNSTYRSKEGPTNVLSFPFEFPPGFMPDDHPAILGDIVLCADIIVEEAALQQKPVNAHWAHIIIHGTLHLLGYDHLDETDAKIMEDLEIKLLARFNFPNPYISHESLTL
jgi:probable rRNA maturation factor